MGGRYGAIAAARAPLPGVRGLCFLGFPLHPPKEPSDARARPLDAVALPMLFLQGTRDELCDLSLLRPVCARLGTRATLHVVEGGDHSFAVLKRDRRRSDEVRSEIVEAMVAWCESVIAAEA